MKEKFVPLSYIKPFAIKGFILEECLFMMIKKKVGEQISFVIDR